MKKLASQDGFSLIEVIIYVALVSIITVSLILFGVQLLEARSAASFDREVISNGRFTINRLTEEIRHATSLDTGTGSFGSHPSAFKLNNNGTGSVVFDTTTKIVNLGGSGYTVRYLRMDENGTGPVQITSDFVNVTNFTVNDLTRGSESANLQIFLSLESLNLDSSLDIQTATSIRQ